MKSLLLSFFLLSVFVLKAQSFDLLYNTTTSPEVIGLSEKSGFYEVRAYEDSAGTRFPLLLRVSLNGALILDSLDLTRPDEVLIDEFYYSRDHLGVIQTISSQGKACFAIEFIDTLSGFLVLRNLVTDTSEYFVERARLYGDTLFVVGSLRNPNNSMDAFVYQWDLPNNRDTIINLGNSNPSIDLASDILKISDKLYIFKTRNSTANCNTFNEVLRFNLDLTLDTTVAICNSISNSANHSRYIISALELPNSEFMISSRAEFLPNPNAPNPEQIGFFRWDTSLVEQQAVLFGKHDSVALEANRAVSRFPGSNSVYIGGTENYVVNSFGYDTSDSYYAITRADLLGNVIWTKYYTNNTFLHLRQVLATSDGGVLLAGTSYDDKTAVGQEKDIWILKLDSNGNYPQTSSLGESLSYQAEILIFPNPVKNQLNIRQLNSEKALELVLFDSNGRIVLESMIDNSDQEVDVSGLPKGIYFYNIREAAKQSNLKSGKLIIK